MLNKEFILYGESSSIYRMSLNVFRFGHDMRFRFTVHLPMHRHGEAPTQKSSLFSNSDSIIGLAQGL
jgi:chromosome condensin MukBEF MukE localization factor